MDQYPERQKLPSHKQSEIDYLNRSTHIKEIESVINNSLKRKHQALMVSVENSTKHLRKKWQQFSIISEKTQAEGTLPNTICVASNILIAKTEKDVPQKENKSVPSMTIDAKISTRY